MATHASPTDRLKPRNTGIWGYMKNAKLVQNDTDDPIPNAEQKDHTQHMTSADYRHFLLAEVRSYRAAPAMKRIVHQNQALLYLKQYNAAAANEGQTTYPTVKAFMKAQSSSLPQRP